MYQWAKTYCPNIHCITANYQQGKIKTSKAELWLYMYIILQARLRPATLTFLNAPRLAFLCKSTQKCFPTSIVTISPNNPTLCHKLCQCIQRIVPLNMDTKKALAVMLLLDHEEMDGDWEIAAPVTLLSHPHEPFSKLFKNKNSENTFNILIYDTWMRKKFVHNVVRN